MKRILFSFLLAFMLWSLPGVALLGTPEISAIGDSREIFEGSTPLNGSYLGDHTYIVGTNKDHFARSIAEMLVRFIKRAMMPIAIGFIIWGGVKLILSRGNEESVFTQRKAETFAIATGFLLFIMAEIMVDNVFFGYDRADPTLSGSILRETPEHAITFAQRGSIELYGLFDFATSFIVAIATLYIITTCIRLLFSLASDSAVQELKNRILYTIMGLALVISIKQIVLLFTKVQHGRIQNPDRASAISFMIDWIDVIIGFIAFIAVIALIWAGFILIAGFGSEKAKETAKSIVKWVIIGLILAFSAWTIIYFFTNGGRV